MSGWGWLDALRAARVSGGLARATVPRDAGDAVLDLAGNDYLGLARDPRVVEAGVAALRLWGAGATGSRLVSGTTALHAELEAGLAAFAGWERGLVFSSGYLANLAAVAALSGPGSLVVSDAASHASIVDGCRLSRARVVVVPHADPDAVRRALAARPEPRALVVTDAVTSAGGDLAPLRELYDASRAGGAALLVDDAHGLGVVGAGGRGAVHAAGLAGADGLVVTATLSKALGSSGGVVLGPAAVRRHLVDTGRSFIFDTGLAPAAAGSALGALRVLEAAPGLPASLRGHAVRLAATARAAGLSAAEPAGAVVSIVVGEPELAVRGAAAALAAGVRVGCFRPPSVPVGTSRLRLCARADLTEADHALAAAALRAVADVRAVTR